MDEVPSLIETEAETSLETDGVEKIYTRVSNNATANNARLSLYNITFDNYGSNNTTNKAFEFVADEINHESVKLFNYESRLNQEMKDWKLLFLNAYNDLKQSKNKHPVVDKTILPPEKLKYLENAENLQNFIRESIEFRQQAVLYLEYEYAELMESIENLETLCEHKLNLAKANKIAENLANI